MCNSLRLALTLSLLLLSSACGGQPLNLLRNGSFEGGTRYWFETEDKQLVKGAAADGEYALRIDHGGIASAAFLLTQSKPVVLSFSARSLGKSATMGWQMTPCSREIGVKNNLTWSMRHFHPVAISDHWKRYSFNFEPTTPLDGFWPRPTYMLQLGDCDGPFEIDAVTIADAGGDDHYFPHAPIEVQTNCADPRGYANASGNLLEKNQTVTVEADASNPGDLEKTVTLRWQLFDYEGIVAVSDPIEKTVVIPAHKCVRQSQKMVLSSSGLVLARSTVLDGTLVLDQSDLPLCSLPYPSHANKPDPAERFGGSIFGDQNLQLVAKVGFAWARWRPHMEWSDHQPDGPDRFHWFDGDLDKLEQLGFSAHFTLFDKPKWAFAKQTDLLPTDMQWPSNDRRWDDLTPACAWDRYVQASVTHYKNRALVYEIENEPEFDWPVEKRELYAKFTIRTARLIKQTNPRARVMVNNVYGIPSALNRYLLEQGAGKWIDIISWHDYHEGWLADAPAIRRMRAALDELGCKHIEIWFNEGWAFTNTAVDEPAVALTHLNAAQSTNAMVDSIAELTEAGQEKTVLFYTGYDDHGMSFWDYAGPGTMLWDYYGYPTPLVPAWNTMVHHLGLSERVALIRPIDANLCIFQDNRNHRGVIVAYADRGAPGDVALDIPLDGLIAEDAMGNAKPLAGHGLKLSKSGRPVFLYSATNTPARTMAEKLAPLDRKNASFASDGMAFELPKVWEGASDGASDGNPARAGNQAIWRLDQVFPVEKLSPESFRPLTWHQGWWLALNHSAGGQPKAELKDGGVRMEFRAPTTESPGEKLCALTFLANRAGTYQLSGTAQLKLWDGDNQVRLSILRKNAERVAEIATVSLARGQAADLKNLSFDLHAGDELVLLPRIAGMFTGGDLTLSHLRIEAGGARWFRVPAAWEGIARGAADGNPILLDGKPIWRLDQVWPDDPTIAANYAPMIWNAAEWASQNHGVGGQPEAKVEHGAVEIGVRGSWSGNPGQRIASLIFVAPATGVYHFTASAHTTPWTGQAATFPLAILKKDTQRALELRRFDLPRNGEAVAIAFDVDLQAGHEIAFVPLMPDWHNATWTTLDSLQCTLRSK